MDQLKEIFNFLKKTPSNVVFLVFVFSFAGIVFYHLNEFTPPQRIAAAIFMSIVMFVSALSVYIDFKNKDK